MHRARSRRGDSLRDDRGTDATRGEAGARRYATPLPDRARLDARAVPHERALPSRTCIEAVATRESISVREPIYTFK
jgi:hypothetical protein